MDGGKTRRHPVLDLFPLRIFEDLPRNNRRIFLVRTYDFVSLRIVRGQPHERSAAVALTRVLATRLVARTQHVVRDQVGRVIGLSAVHVVHDRHVHLLQDTRRLAILVQRAPSGRLAHVVHVRVVCRWINNYRILIVCKFTATV